ncbi:AAA family ATPase [Clostridium sp.]|uniref:ATP-dependent nuclease n=1 Tax=Clostridium sp. TaxID=1506 RepID=UPI00283FCDA7|nr:AAA family ATPase [Clostridium sp.]MDR3596528.1 AAA family ATPase [Clostridium sp.]
MENKLSELIETIRRQKNNNIFPNYIDYIQFPFFRNIELDQRINFDYPLTIFVGPNGSGKSSTLHALYGCPAWKTPYDFWFSTVIDPVEYISESRKIRHSFFYGYRKDGTELQVIKTRIKKRNNPDYWETSRPLLSYGMDKLPEGISRNSPINKNVVYLDFRAELSAFDKYFYFETPPPNLSSKTKQDYLRVKSKTLNNIFNGKYDIVLSSGQKPQNETVIHLSFDELNEISKILGKIYLEGKVIRHRLFHTWGYSILLKNQYCKYSEAFAGSGEISVVRLVQNILSAKVGSLILLDEPEVSLHPGAQKRLQFFLLDQIKKKKHQVIISTHSAYLIEALPKEAIKVFSQKLDNGKFIIKENILPEEAFYFIGQEIDEKISIIVEDALAKKLLNKVLEELGSEVINMFKILFLPGGAGTINKHYIPIYNNANIQRSFFVFDGDQKLVDNLFDCQNLQERDKTILFLKQVILNQTNCDIPFYVDGNVEGGNQVQRINMMINFLNYYKKHVFYLPQLKPEDIIWSNEVMDQYLTSVGSSLQSAGINNLPNSKQKINEVSKIIFGSINQNATEDLLITAWLKRKEKNYTDIVGIIDNLKSLGQ